MHFYHKENKRNKFGYSLLETMTVIAVIAIVLGLLYAYSDQGWKLFYQSYNRGLSQIKAKLAIRIISDELREANKNRITINRGTSIGVPIPDDAQESTPYIYFTKPKAYEQTGDVIAYDYILYYFAKPKIKDEPSLFERNKKRIREKEQYLILKSIKFLDQSKYYTEDGEKTWPFQPPIIELNKSTLPEDDSFKGTLTQSTENQELNNETATTKPEVQELFLDHFARIKKESRNLPISGNFTATALTDPFSAEEATIYWGQSYTIEKPIKIKVAIEESPFLFGIKAAMTEFEVKITPRN